jgi:hypothetical protein
LSIKRESERARALFLPVVVPLKRVQLLKPMHKRNHAWIQDENASLKAYDLNVALTSQLLKCGNWLFLGHDFAHPDSAPSVVASGPHRRP